MSVPSPASISAAAQPRERDQQPWLKAVVGHEHAVLALVLAALVVGLSLASDQFLSAANAVAILRQVALVLIVAVGMTMLLVSGEVDVSVGASMAFTSCVVMDVINRTGSLPAGLFAGIAFAASVGLLNGVIVTRLRVSSLIATIATMMMLQGGVFLYTREAVQNHHQIGAFGAIAAGYVGPLPVPVIVAALITLVALLILGRTTWGRYLLATGANPRAARLSGVRTGRVKVAAFVATGALVGVAAAILASLLNAGQPTAGRGFELVVIAAVILGGTSLAGGRGTVLGTILGVLVLKVIDNGIVILRWNQDLQMIVPGVVIILATWMDRLRRPDDGR